VVQSKIEFKAGKATIAEDSQTVIEELATFLNENADIKSLRIEVHSDAGNRRKSKRLAKKRAKAIRTALTKKGVKKRRLKYKGLARKSDDGEDGDKIVFKILKRR